MNKVFIKLDNSDKRLIEFQVKQKGKEAFDYYKDNIDLKKHKELSTIHYLYKYSMTVLYEYKILSLEELKNIHEENVKLENLKGGPIIYEKVKERKKKEIKCYTRNDNLKERFKELSKCDLSNFKLKIHITPDE